MASHSTEPPSTFLLAPFVPPSTMVIGPDAMQAIPLDQRRILEMCFTLLASLSDGTTFPRHQIQVPGSIALMPKNRLHFTLLLTIDQHGSVFDGGEN